MKRARMLAGVKSIQRCAWHAAGRYLDAVREGYVRDARIEGQAYAHGLLSALYLLDATPDGRPLDVTSLIGARAWTDGALSLQGRALDAQPLLLTTMQP